MVVEELNLIESFRDLNLVVELRPNSLCSRMLKNFKWILERNKESSRKGPIFARKLDKRKERNES